MSYFGIHNGCQVATKWINLCKYMAHLKVKCDMCEYGEEYEKLLRNDKFINPI